MKTENTIELKFNKRNFLNALQKYKLFDFVKNNVESAEKSTFNDFAKAATEALGFKVTEQNIAYARAALGLKKKKRASRSNDRVRVVCLHLVELYKFLNIQIPNDLKLVACGHSLNQNADQ